MALKSTVWQTSPVKYAVRKVQVHFPHSLLRCCWLWGGGGGGGTISDLCLLWDFLCLLYFKNSIWRTWKKILLKNPWRFKSWMRVVGQMLINLEMSFIRGFLQFLLLYPLGSNLCKHADSGSWRVHLITRVWRSGSSLGFSALFDICLQQWFRQIVNVKHSILSGKFAFMNLGFHAFVIFIQRSVTCPCVNYIGSQYDASAKVSTVNTHTIIDINIIIQSYQIHYSVLNW